MVLCNQSYGFLSVEKTLNAVLCLYPKGLLSIVTHYGCRKAGKRMAQRTYLNCLLMSCNFRGNFHLFFKDNTLSQYLTTKLIPSGSDFELHSYCSVVHHRWLFRLRPFSKPENTMEPGEILILFLETKI